MKRAHLPIAALALLLAGCDKPAPQAEAPAQMPETKEPGGAEAPAVDTLKKQAEEVAQGKEKSWSLTYSGELEGKAQGEGVVIGDMGAIVSVALGPTKATTTQGVAISIMDGKKDKAAGFESRLNKILLKKGILQGYKCVSLKGKVTVTRVDEQQKTQAGTFESDMSCTKLEEKTLVVKKIQVQGKFSS